MLDNGDLYFKIRTFDFVNYSRIKIVFLNIPRCSHERGSEEIVNDNNKFRLARRIKTEVKMKVSSDKRYFDTSLALKILQSLFLSIDFREFVAW